MVSRLGHSTASCQDPELISSREIFSGPCIMAGTLFYTTICKEQVKRSKPQDNRRKSAGLLHEIMLSQKSFAQLSATRRRSKGLLRRWGCICTQYWSQLHFWCCICRLMYWCHFERTSHAIYIKGWARSLSIWWFRGIEKDHLYWAT